MSTGFRVRVNVCRVMKKTQEYLSSFARFKTTEAIHAVERYFLVPWDIEVDVCRVLRNDVDLHKFEVAQLGSLCPEEAEEAKTLIPRFSSLLLNIHSSSSV